MSRIEDDIISLIALIMMVLTVVGMVSADSIFRIHQLSIALFIIYYPEWKKKHSEGCR